MGMDALPSPTKPLQSDGLSLSLRQTRPVWKDMMSGCEDIYSSTSWLLVKILIVVSVNCDCKKKERSETEYLSPPWQIDLRFLGKRILKMKNGRIIAKTKR